MKASFRMLFFFVQLCNCVKVVPYVFLENVPCTSFSGTCFFCGHMFIWDMFLWEMYTTCLSGTCYCGKCTTCFSGKDLEELFDKAFVQMRVSPCF